MALIKCRECGNMISDSAEKCPKCGAPLENGRGSVPSYVKTIAIASVALVAGGAILQYFTLVYIGLGLLFLLFILSVLSR